jgi:hypothetical protein
MPGCTLNMYPQTHRSTAIKHTTTQSRKPVSLMGHSAANRWAPAPCMPRSTIPVPLASSFIGIHLNNITLLPPRDAPPRTPTALARGTQAFRHFRMGPLKEAALLLTDPYRVEERLWQGVTMSSCVASAATGVRAHSWEAECRRRRRPEKMNCLGATTNCSAGRAARDLGAGSFKKTWETRG